MLIIILEAEGEIFIIILVAIRIICKLNYVTEINFEQLNTIKADPCNLQEFFIAFFEHF